MAVPSRHRVAGAFALFQLADAVACAVPLGFIERSLDAIDCPPALRRVLPVIKVAAATGLLVGRRRPEIGRLTAASLLGYYAVAVGWHIGADDADQIGPATALGITSGYLLLAR